jgi:hypothetical protein
MLVPEAVLQGYKRFFIGGFFQAHPAVVICYGLELAPEHGP